MLHVPSTDLRISQMLANLTLEGLMLKLKLQYFGHLMQRTDSLEKTLLLGKIEGGRRRGRQRTRWLDGISDSVDTSLLSKLQIWSWTGKPGMLQSMGSQRGGLYRVTKLNWIFPTPPKIWSFPKTYWRILTINHWMIDCKVDQAVDLNFKELLISRNA